MKNKFSDNTSNIDSSSERNQEPTEKGEIKLLDVVALTQDASEHNLKRGEVGTVVEILSNGEAFEVELSDDNGQMYKCLSFSTSQLRVIHDEPISESDQKQEPATRKNPAAQRLIKAMEKSPLEGNSLTIPSIYAWVQPSQLVLVRQKHLTLPAKCGILLP